MIKLRAITKDRFKTHGLNGLAKVQNIYIDGMYGRGGPATWNGTFHLDNEFKTELFINDNNYYEERGECKDGVLVYSNRRIYEGSVTATTEFKLSKVNNNILVEISQYVDTFVYSRLCPVTVENN